MAGMLDLILPVLCGYLTGLALGLTGGGGSIFAVPLLTFIVGLPISQSTALSLIAVSITAGLGAARGILRGLAAIQVAVPMMIMGMLASPLGVFLSQHVPEQIRLALFAALMLGIAAKMILSPNTEPKISVFSADMPFYSNRLRHRLLHQLLIMTRHPYFALTVGGILTGILSGFFGVGGGFLIVPTLLYATSLTMREIVSTSMLIVTGVSIVAFSAFLLTPTELPTSVSVLFIIGNIIGLGTGIKLAQRLSNERLQRIFAFGIAFVGLYTGLRVF